MSQTQLSDVALIANDEVVPFVSDSLSWTEGTGEQSMRALSTGGGNVEIVYSNDVSTNMSNLKFKLASTPEAIELARSWKASKNQNLFQVAGKNADGGEVTRTFSQAAVTNDYEVNVGTDADLEIEIMSLPAI